MSLFTVNTRHFEHLSCH